MFSSGRWIKSEVVAGSLAMSALIILSIVRPIIGAERTLTSNDSSSVDNCQALPIAMIIK